MDRREALRWSGSIGIFYILIPTFILISDYFYAKWLTLIPRVEIPMAARNALAALALPGLYLIVASITTMVRRGQGHPFDLDGTQVLSRPTQHLLNHGVYYWTRNPMGLGDLLLYAALAGATNAWHSLIINIPLWAIIVCWNHCINERPALVRRFGKAFLEYEQSTSCLIPGMKTFRKISHPMKKG
ncbi:MAG: hypothetical protein IPK83_02955 [Planctomycetes bacterium]|nr:hypothetical protein [Planctomycetota bacterium]